MEPFRELKAYLYTKALLQPDQVNPQIQEAVELYTLDLILHELALLVDCLLATNRIVDSLQALKKQVEYREEDFTLADRLLFKNRQLVILTDNINEVLITDLIREVHDQISFIYSR